MSPEVLTRAKRDRHAPSNVEQPPGTSVQPTQRSEPTERERYQRLPAQGAQTRDVPCAATLDNLYGPRDHSAKSEPGGRMIASQVFEPIRGK